MKLRVVTYNIHKCIGGLDRRYVPERVRDVIASFDPDVVLLQEVDEGARRSGGHRQVDVLGDMLTLRHRAFFPNVRLRDGGHYGNAVLSRYPMSYAQNIDLTVPMSKRRSVLHVRARVRGARHLRTVHVYNLHLGLTQILRQMQLQRFLASRPFVDLHHRTPIILGGDFNDVWGSIGRECLGPVGFRGPERPLATFPAWAPFRALDALYVRGDATLSEVCRPALAAARWASDHLPLFGEIELR